MNVFITEQQEKTADINVKSDFTTNGIQTKILSEAQQALPLLKDLKYGLVIKNKDMLSGDLYGTIKIQVPSKKYNDVETRVSIPIFIKNFYMSPIDTILINNAAYPINDGIVKEFLQDPETFRILKSKEIQETRILAKLAEADPDNLKTELDKFIDNTKSDVYKLFSITQKRGLEEFEQVKQASEDYTEPIFECILEKNASNNFDLTYLKRTKTGNIEFATETINPNEARLLLETIGYNIKVAEKATKKGGVRLKAPMSYPKGESLPIDLNKVEKTRIVETLRNGPAEVMTTQGNKIEGVLFDIVTFSSATNQYPEGKLFMDYKHNYCISSNFQGRSIEKDLILAPDDETSYGEGFYIDDVKGIAYGPIKILNWITNPSSLDDFSSQVNYKGKKFNIKKLKGITRNMVEGNTITIPEFYTWHKINNKIDIVDNVNDLVLNKVAETSYKISNASNGTYTVSSIKDLTKKASIPSEKHLVLFLDRINLITEDLEKTAENIKNGKSLVFTSDYPMDELFIKKEADKVIPKKLQSDIFINKFLEPIKVANDKLTNFWEQFFELARDKEFVESLEPTAESLLDYDADSAICKLADTFEALDTIFSLNMINDSNSSIFLQSVDKLKSTVSTLAALRVYLRLGWNVTLNESDINQALDGLMEIIHSLELIKSQKLLSKQNV
jgi:hypothetical protein